MRLQRFHVYRLPDGRKVSADLLYAPGSMGARPIGWVLLLPATGWPPVHPDGRIRKGNGEHTGWRTGQLEDLGRLGECQQCDAYPFALCAHREAS